MKVVLITLLSLLLFYSCGPQDGTERQTFYSQGPQGQNNSNQGNGPPAPGVTNPNDSQNYLANLEMQYPCKTRMRKVVYSTSHTQTTINGISNDGRHNGPIYKKYVGKSYDNNLIYIEQISHDGVNAIGFNITFSFCENFFPVSVNPYNTNEKIYMTQSSKMSIFMKGAMVLDSRAQNTVHDVDSAPIRINIPNFTIQINDPILGTYPQEYPQFIKDTGFAPIR
ncbi:MAG: hypothetical protein VXY34_05020 [Bdellovibrionota bacterium]|nr:hypothetical protein [Bdellovibrionota bacterium]MEC8624160.1 hypothetical protein [Bdellovibrionota bacterium]